MAVLIEAHIAAIILHAKAHARIWKVVVVIQNLMGMVNILLNPHWRKAALSAA